MLGKAVPSGPLQPHSNSHMPEALSRDRNGRMTSQIGISRLIKDRSVGVAADHLAAAAGPEGPPGREVHRVLDESDGAVGHRHVDAAGVEACGRGGAEDVQGACVA